jgi:hypothetical protein
VARRPVDEPADPLELVGVVERAVSTSSSSGGRWCAGGLLGERGDEVVVDAGRGDDPGGRGAVLTGVEVAGDGDGLGGGLDVGVVEDHDRGLAAQLEVHALEVVRAHLATCHAGRTGPGDRDHLRDLVRATSAGRCRGRRRSR